MNVAGETREKLLLCAKKEFLEKGYQNASLRNICKNVDVTTGALYFCFQNKEDLFRSIVEEPLQTIYTIMLSHFQDEIDQINHRNLIWASGEDSGDFLIARQMIHYMYRNYDVFQMLLTKSQGSGYETCLDQFVDLIEKHYRRLADGICEQKHLKKLDDYMIHWMAHMNMETFIHMLTHEKDEERAVSHMKRIIKFLIAGWNELFQE